MHHENQVGRRLIFALAALLAWLAIPPARADDLCQPLQRAAEVLNEQSPFSVAPDASQTRIVASCDDKLVAIEMRIARPAIAPDWQAGEGAALAQAYCRPGGADIDLVPALAKGWTLSLSATAEDGSTANLALSGCS